MVSGITSVLPITSRAPSQQGHESNIGGHGCCPPFLRLYGVVGRHGTRAEGGIDDPGAGGKHIGRVDRAKSINSAANIPGMALPRRQTSFRRIARSSCISLRIHNMPTHRKGSVNVEIRPLFGHAKVYVHAPNLVLSLHRFISCIGVRLPVCIFLYTPPTTKIANSKRCHGLHCSQWTS